MKNMKLFWRMSGYFLISALFFAFGGNSLRAQGTFELLKSNSLSEGDEVIIVATGAAKAMSTTQNNNNRGEAEITKNQETIQPGSDVCVFMVKQGTKDNTLAFYDSTNKGYICAANSSNNHLKTETTLSDNSSWSISIAADGTATLTAQGSYTRNLMQYNSSSKIFACYASATQGGVSIYKKQVATCDQVSNATENVLPTKVTLSWTAPDPAPDNGYKVSISAGGTEVVKDAVVAAGTTTYTKEDLTAGTDYTYKIVSVCGEGSTSDAVTGSFSTPAADAKTLNVEMSGAMEGDKYTTAQPIVFTFTTTNFTLGSDGKISYTIIGDGDNNNNYEKEGVITENTLSLNDITAGEYEAEFELVDMDEQSFEAPVKVEKTFTVKLPKLAAPEFSPDEQTTAFISAQTITLTAAEGATIHYAINDAAEVEYTTPIALTESGTYIIKAYASKTGMENSETITKTYTLKLPRPLAPGVMFYEPFDGFVNAGTGVLDTKLDEYTELPGWEGKYVYQQSTGGVVKIGKGSSGDDPGFGYLQTPSIALVAGSDYVLSFDAQAWSKDSDKLTVKIGETDYEISGLANDESVSALPGKMNSFEQTFTATGTTVIRIASNPSASSGKGRFFLDNIMVKENVVCNEVKELGCEHTGSTAVISWEVENAPALGYAIEVRKADNTLVKQDTVKDPATHTYTLENLADGEYNYSVTALCRADLASDPVSDHFEIVPAGQPTISIVKPAAGTFTRDSVMFTCKVSNFVLGTGEEAEGSIQYTITGTNLTAPVTGTITDTFFYHKFERSGRDTVRLELVDKSGASLNPVKVVRRAFTINLPDVAAPVFTPAETSHNDAIEVSISCDTVGASIYYSLNKGEYTLYSTPIAISKTGTYEFKAFATKAKMDTSKVTTKTYTVKMPSAARPVFTPTATFHRDSIKVAIECDTVGASIYYSLNDAEFVPYTDSIKLNANGTYAFKAFATKAGLDTSAMATKTYTIKFTEPLEPGVMFYEPFDGLIDAGSGAIDAKLDDYTTISGWTGEAVYMQVPGIAKMGTGKLNGYLQTPVLSNLTAGEKYLLSFDAQAWNGDSDKLTLTIGEEEYEISGLVNNENVGNNNTPTQMQTFEKEFTAASATTIRIAANGTVGKSRFFLDNVKIEVLSDDPAFNVASSLTMSTVQGTPVSRTVTVTGRNLTEDITVSCPEGNFSVSPATLAKEAVMGENGAELTVTFNGNEASDNVTITLAHGELSKTIEVSATATTAQEVENLAALREKDADESTVYQVKGEVVVTAVDGNSVWAQDASAAILIYGATGQQYKVGDGISGIYGTLKNYNDLIELLPSGNQPAATSHDKVVEPEVMTVEALNEAGAEYSSRLVRINGLTLIDAEGVWAGSTNYKVTDEVGDTLAIRTTITKGSYIGEALPADTFDLIAVVGIYNGTIQVSPRVKEDIIVAGGDEPGTANEVAAELACRLYPNPTTGVFFVEVAENARMEIFTLGGMMVRNEMLKAGKTELRLSQSGIYFIRLTNANAATVKRVIVR